VQQLDLWVSILFTKLLWGCHVHQWWGTNWCSDSCCGPSLMQQIAWEQFNESGCCTSFNRTYSCDWWLWNVMLLQVAPVPDIRQDLSWKWHNKILLCLMSYSYKTNKLFIAAVKQNNIFSFHFFLLEPSRCVFTKYSNSKFSQNTTILLSIKVVTCFDSRSHHQANYWTMFEVHQVKVQVKVQSKHNYIIVN